MPRVMANSRKSLPTTSLMNKSGMSTAMREMVRERMVKPICFAPLSAASRGLSPSSMYRAMFSIITMASSTTKPVEMVRAIKERLLRLNPRRYMAPKVPIRERGTATLGMSVAERLRRKRKITMTTSATASISSNSTSLTEALIVVVRSVRMETCTLDGREPLSWGNRALMWSTT